jgi:hypothetical protein
VRRFRQWFRSQTWSATMPVYVTRANADGFIGTWSITAGTGLVLFVLLLVNLLVWGVVGIVAGLGVLF